MNCISELFIYHIVIFYHKNITAFFLTAGLAINTPATYGYILMVNFRSGFLLFSRDVIFSLKILTTYNSSNLADSAPPNSEH